MKTRSFLTLLVLQLLVLMLCFPYTPRGEQFVPQLFPQGNGGEDALLRQLQDEANAQAAEIQSGDALADHAPSDEALTSEVPAVDTPEALLLSDFYTVVTDELPGRYTLVSLHTPDAELTDGLIESMRALGFLMALELHADESAIIGIFDQAVLSHFSFDRMLAVTDGEVSPFFYHSGRLRIQSGTWWLLFEKE